MSGGRGQPAWARDLLGPETGSGIGRDGSWLGPRPGTVLVRLRPGLGRLAFPPWNQGKPGQARPGPAWPGVKNVWKTFGMKSIKNI